MIVNPHWLCTSGHLSPMLGIIALRRLSLSFQTSSADPNQEQAELGIEPIFWQDEPKADCEPDVLPLVRPR
jgi:hypothetical protein